MTDGVARPQAVHSGRKTEPLVLHVIPTPMARGAQVEARGLVDRLDEPGVRRHRLLCLYGVDDALATTVDVDESLEHRGAGEPGVGFDPRLVLRLRSALGRLDPALVVAHGGEPLKYLVPALAGRRCPLAYYAIGTLADPAHRPARKLLWRTLLRRPVVVACEGQEVLDECAQVLGIERSRLVLAPNGRDPGRFRPRPAAAARPVPVLTFVGALTTGKRPDRFVALVAALRARDVSVKARLAGDGPMRDELSGPARDAGVDLLGARDDIAELMRDSDVFVFPSLPRGEGMPGVLIEAGLSGLPVVATAVPGVASVIVDGETGVVVPPEEFDALVDATAALVGDPGRRTAMGEAARARCAEHFSLDVVTGIWRGFLLPLLEARRRAA